MKIRFSLVLMLLFSVAFYAQEGTILKGKVLDKQYRTPLNIAIVQEASGKKSTLVSSSGDFVLEFAQAPPVKVVISAVGYKKYEYTVTSNEEEITVYLEEEATSLDEIVVSASRTPERIFESPVSVERIGLAAIEAVTAPTFYDGIENLKGVDVNAGSLTFKTVNTRGFASFGNTRFVQLVDGMDNSSPGLNFPLGNLIGLSELDVQSVELLPGASSALYGANAFNGILFMRSKSPFLHTGTTMYGKTGFTNSENAGMNEFIDVGVRVARKVNPNFALKFTTSFLKATDWFATDSRNIDGDGKIIDGDRFSEQGLDYNGINIYGDEFTNPEDLGFGIVSRTGYAEQDLISPDTDSFRASFAAHWRPFGDDEDVEVIYTSKYGTGNTIYQGASRYALRNFIMHQHKLELQTKHLMLRSYVTFEDAGDSYDIRFAGINTLRSQNNAARATDPSRSVDELWFGTYGLAFAGLLPGTTLGDRSQARKVADAAFRTNPNSKEFNTIFNRVINDSDVTTGAKFVDSSRLFHSDINYNFKDQIKFAELQLGASARRYSLNSEGTLFTDQRNKISYDEYGVYTQIQKKMLEDRLKLTGSLRYDKAQNFDGNFSPRVSVVYSPDQDKNHNLRASFQTGFRNPTTQEQYVGLFLGNTVLIGSAPDNPERYNRRFNVSSAGGIFAAGGTSVNFNGLQGYKNSFTRSSVEAFSDAVKTSSDSPQVAAARNAGLLKQANFDFVKPEQVRSYELGYRGKLAKKTILDVSAYYNQYKDFIAIVTTVSPLYGNVSALKPAEVATDFNTQLLLNALANDEFTPTSLYTNTNVDVASYGVNIGLETKLFSEYDFGINYAYAKQDFDRAKDPDFETGFNTPEHKVKVSLANNNIYKGLGFGINVRWQDAFYWESTFVDGQVEARTLLDAQLTYNIKQWRSKVKVGGANILGNEYEAAPGSATIGSQVYGSWTYTF